MVYHGISELRKTPGEGKCGGDHGGAEGAVGKLCERVRGIGIWALGPVGGSEALFFLQPGL